LVNSPLQKKEDLLEKPSDKGSDIPKFFQVSEKRNSQKPSESSATKLDKQKQSKRPASDDDKGVDSDEDNKKLGKKEQSIVISKLKLNLKNI
jgi:hypothetical protein